MRLEYQRAYPEEKGLKIPVIASASGIFIFFFDFNLRIKVWFTALEEQVFDSTNQIQIQLTALI